MRALSIALILAAAMLIIRDDARGRLACEKLHSPATCTHILRS